MRTLSIFVTAASLFVAPATSALAANAAPGTTIAPQPNAPATGGIKARPIGPVTGPTATRLPMPTATAAPATTQLNCADGKSYEVSTGTNTGTCEVQVENGKPVSAGCKEITYNVTEASCSNGCGSTRGSASCRQIK